MTGPQKLTDLYGQTAIPISDGGACATLDPAGSPDPERQNRPSVPASVFVGQSGRHRRPHRGCIFLPSRSAFGKGHSDSQAHNQVAQSVNRIGRCEDMPW